MSKRIECIRGGSLFPDFRRKDDFNSIINVYRPENDTPVYSGFQLNTDFYNGYHGGILSEGEYSYICGYRQDSGKKCLFIFNKIYYDKVLCVSDLNLNMRTLPSLIENPNNGNAKIITCVLLHGDFQDGGGSHGCLTMQKNYWINFIALFTENEKGSIILKRAPDWKAPSYYGGK